MKVVRKVTHEQRSGPPGFKVTSWAPVAGRNPRDLGGGAPDQLLQGGFTFTELIVVVTVVTLLAALAVGAYNKFVNDAKVAKSIALINTLSTAKSLFVSDPKTTPAMITTFNGGPDAQFGLIAPYIRINGTQPADVGTLLSLSGMPASVKITLGTVDDTSFGSAGTHSPDVAPTVTGYGL